MTFIVNPGLSLAPGLAAPPIGPNHYCISKLGVFDDSKKDYRSSPGLMEAAMAEYAKVAGTKSLALFFHGGLVSWDLGIKNAEQLVGPYSASKTANPPGGEAFPYFFVWESGLLETLLQRLHEIAAEPTFTQVHAIIAPHALAKLGATPSTAVPSNALFASSVGVSVPPQTRAVEATPAEVAQIEREVAADPQIRAEKERIARSARPLADALAEAQSTPSAFVQMSPVTLLSPEIVASIAAEETIRNAFAPAGPDSAAPAGGGIIPVRAGRVFTRMLHRFAIGRDHGFHNTLVEEILREFYIGNIGTQIWTDMKKATAAAFGPDPAKFVGTKMIQELIKLYDTGKRPRVTLIGHSAGAVYIANFLAAMDTALRGKPYASEIRFDVIVMAPAVRADTFAATLSAHGKRIGSFRWFSMHDALELKDILVQRPVPPGTAAENALLAGIYGSSLLYFISGVLENDDGDGLGDTPLVGMERYFTGAGPYGKGKIPTIDAVASFLHGGARRQVFSDTSTVKPPPAVGLRCTSHHHGGFPSDPATLESVCYLLRTGSY